MSLDIKIGMNMLLGVLLITLSLIVLSGCASDEIIDGTSCINELTPQEREAGWRSLFDGQSLINWRSYQEDELNTGWAIENGCLARVGMRNHRQ